jgi:hypothetical protein
MKTFKLFNFRRSLTLLAIVGTLLVPMSSALADPIPTFTFTTPVFGLAAAPDGSLLVADAGSGIVELRNGEGSLVAALPGISDVAPIGRGDMFALTGIGDAKLYRVSHGNTSVVADLFAFEAEVNPHDFAVDSNPFDVAVLTGGQALVADAGGNDLLIVDQRGNVDWIALLPDELVSTENAKDLVGCPDPVPGLEFVCGFPDMVPAQAVATSVAIGPDGAYYVGELKGFPAPTGFSKVWRIEPGARHADCATSSDCSVVASGFTSIVDLAFGPDGTLYVVEMDEASWAAVELGLGGVGGTVNACDSSTWTCTEVATGLPMPLAVAVDKTGTLYATVMSLVPGAAQVISLP